MKLFVLAPSGQTTGPFATEDIQAHLLKGEINGETLVWREGLAEWTSFSSLPEFKTFPSESTPRLADAAVHETQPPPVSATPDSSYPDVRRTRDPSVLSKTIPINGLLWMAKWMAILSGTLFALGGSVTAALFYTLRAGIVPEFAGARDLIAGGFYLSMLGGGGLLIAVMLCVLFVGLRLHDLLTAKARKLFANTTRRG